MTKKEKQELGRNVAVAFNILLIAGVMVFFTGWFFALCFVGVAWPVEKMIERVFSKEISSAADKGDAFFNAVCEKVKPTWLGKLFSKIYSFFYPNRNDWEREAELRSVVSGNINTTEVSEEELSSLSSLSVGSDISECDSDEIRNTGEIYLVGLKCPISRESSESNTELELLYNSSFKSDSENNSRTELLTEGSEADLSTELDTDDESDLVKTGNRKLSMV